MKESVKGDSVGGRGVILLFGPLLWDEDAVLRDWRRDRLDMGRAERVHVPVLYCRTERSGAHAIVPSRRDSPDAGGIAHAVPFRSGFDIPLEAQALWNAECRDARAVVGAAWGTVGLLCRPGSPWRRRWTALVRAGLVLLPDHRERTPLGADGIVDMDWPGRLGGGDVDCDAILVVVAVPAVPVPTVEEIGTAFVADDEAREHFYRNRLSGVTTVLDTAIIREMRALI